MEIEVEFPNSKDSQKLISKHRLIRGWEIDFDGCFDAQTMILTDSGWKYFKDLTYQDKVLSMNPSNLQSKYCEIKKIYQKNYNNEMYLIDNNRLSMLLSPEHYIYARDLIA